MLVRNLAMGLSLAMASMVQAGAVVELVRIPDTPTYAQGEVVKVEVLLRQNATNPDHALRQIQFDLNASDPALGLDLLTTHTRTLLSTDDIKFWYFGSTPRCASVPATCGEKHFLVQNLGSTVNPGPGILSATYGIDNFDNSIILSKNLQMQITVKGDGTTVKVGEMNVTMPSADGSYTLDLLNAAETNVDKGGQLRFGFSLGGTETITRWSASGGQVTGGTYTFVVSGGGGNPTGACCDTSTVVCTDGVEQVACGGASEVWTEAVLCANLNPPCSGPVAANLTGSDPACDISWPRSAKNFAMLTFDQDLVKPTSSEVQIRELLAAGAFGPNISGNFTFSIVNDGGGLPRILRVVENGTQLTDRTWYAITNNGWASAAAFEVDIVHLIGDEDGNGRVLSADVVAINSSISIRPVTDSRRDIDGNNRVLSADVVAANAKINVRKVSKPTGHSCLP